MQHPDEPGPIVHPAGGVQFYRAADQVGSDSAGAAAALCLQDKYGRTPLIVALMSNKFHIGYFIIPLMDAKALLAQDKYGNTAMHLAALGGHEGICRLILKRLSAVRDGQQP